MLAKPTGNALLGPGYTGFNRGVLRKPSLHLRYLKIQIEIETGIPHCEGSDDMCHFV